MSAPSTTFDLLSYVLRTELARYRDTRANLSPFRAATQCRDSAARFLADSVIENDHPEQYEVEAYRAALAIYDAVVKRADIGGGVAFPDLTRSQRFWSTGKRDDAAVTA